MVMSARFLFVASCEECDVLNVEEEETTFVSTICMILYITILRLNRFDRYQIKVGKQGTYIQHVQIR